MYSPSASHATTSVPEQVLVVRPNWEHKQYWTDLWRYRELFLILAWRDVSVRYKQTIIGVLWALLRPLLMVVVFTIAFGSVAKLPSVGTAPYALMVFAGVLPWTLFATSFGEAANSLVTSANLVSKVYFPRMIVPTAKMVTALIDLLLSLVVFAGLMAFYGYAPGRQILLLPGFIVLALATSLGPSLWITALNVKYRDFSHVVPFLAQLGLYVSPVGFSSAAIPAEWRLLYSLNPMVGVIDGFRWCLLSGESLVYWPGFAMSLVISAVMLWLGINRFRRMEASFADLI